LDKGATFIVSLPVAALQDKNRKLASPDDGQHAPDLPNLQGIKVLAVDDDHDSLEIVKRILSGRNAEVQIASSADEAMEVFAAFTPDVILSDVGMPGKDGYDLIRMIRKHPKGSKTPAAALTALARAEDRMRALTAGFQTHIAKPVSSAEIVATVLSLASMRERVG
jgi:CheY-like chemotaxis protein